MPLFAEFTRHTATHNILAHSPFHLVDVGASGGIDEKWAVFGKNFQAFGFDPLVKECERLNKLEPQGKAEYVPAFVGAPDHMEFPGRRAGTQNMPRLSVTLANNNLNINANVRYNSFQEVVLAQSRITLDEFFSGREEKPDFLKIDTDGHDIEVLYGSEELFSKNCFLGVCVEAQFHGEAHPRSNTFANIDIFLRERGFVLFDMEYYRYSRSALPGKFLISIPAQTDIGQIQWADAYYFRDLGDRNYINTWGGHYTETDIVKLACLFELQGLNDCAVELLTVHREALGKIMNVDLAGDLLCPPINGSPKTVKDYQKRFDCSVESMRILKEITLRDRLLEKSFNLKAYNRILLFGAGGRLQAGLPELENHFSKDSMIAIVDNAPNKWGTTWCSLPVVSPQEIVQKRPDAVIIVSTFAHDILNQLIELKIEHHLDFKIWSY